MVLFSHYSNNTGFLNGVLGHDGGQFGVMLFFMLSGFLMSLLYFNQPFNPQQIRRYAVARFARVVPLFVVVVLLSWLLPKLGVSGIFYDIKDGWSLLAHFLLLNGNSVLWTIPPEIQFYGLFVLLWWLYAGQRSLFYLCVAAIIVVLWLLGLPAPERHLGPLLIKFKILMALHYFLAGVLFGLLYRYRQVPTQYRKQGFVFVLLLIPLLYPDIFYQLTGYKHAVWREPFVYAAMCVVFYVIVFLVPDDHPWLANRLGDHLGKVSYSLYLLHLPVLFICLDIIKLSPNFFLIPYLLLAVLSATLSYRLLEDPMRRLLRQRWTDKT